MESYRTEEEQVEALKRWWSENGRSTIVAIVVALGLGFGYQGFKGFNKGQAEGASELYQRMLQSFASPAISAEQEAIPRQLAAQLKADFDSSIYAQFAALHLARLAVAANDLSAAEAELRWVLGKADAGSDVARIARQRLARVLAASGDPDQGLAILAEGSEGPYKASYAVARGDVLLSVGRHEEASEAYTEALALAADNNVGFDLVLVQQKLQALNPVAAREAVAIQEVVIEAPEEPAGQSTESVDSDDDNTNGEG